MHYHLFLLSFGLVVLSLPATMATDLTLQNCDSLDPSQYDRIIIEGKPYERGVSYGKQARDKIHRSLDYYKLAFSEPLTWPECIQFVKDNYLLGIQEYYPTGLEEMRGIADGAGVSLEEIVVLNARYDLSRVHRARKIENSKRKNLNTANATEVPTVPSPCNTTDVEMETATPGECTGAVVLKSATTHGDVLIGQNWDVNEYILNNDTAMLLQVHPHEKIKPFVMLTEAGQLGRSGMNSDGLGIVAMSLWSTQDVFVRDPIKYPKGWLPISLLRRMFLESPTFSLGIRAVLQKPRHVSTNMIIATAEDEALNIELTPDDYFIMNIPTDKEILAHSNHFKTPAFLARDNVHEGSRGSSSLFRDRRVEKTLLSHWPNITEESFQTAFKDHVGYPNSVCEHSVPPELAYTNAFPKQTTVASIVFNLSKKKFFLCKGPPCTGTYRSYSLNTSEIAGSCNNVNVSNFINKTSVGSG